MGLFKPRGRFARRYRQKRNLIQLSVIFEWRKFLQKTDCHLWQSVFYEKKALQLSNGRGAFCIEITRGLMSSHESFEIDNFLREMG